MRRLVSPVIRMMHAKALDGLSPMIRTHQCLVDYPTIVGMREGTLLEVPEVSVVSYPKIPDARWLGI